MRNWVQDPEDEFGPQPASLNPSVREHIANKYNLAGDVADAQQTTADVQFGDDLARAGATIGAAISGPGVQVDNKFWDTKAGRNQQIVEDVIARQSAADSDVERQQRDLKIEDADKTRKQQTTLSDPTNKLAVLAREKLKSIGYDVSDSMSLTDMRAAGINPFELFDKTKQREYENKLKAEDTRARQVEARGRAEERALIREERQLEKEEKLELKQEEKLRKREVPGVGIALTDQDAKDLKLATEGKAKFDRMLTEMINLRKTKGAEVFDREAVSRGQQLSKDLLLAYKDLAKLGVLSVSDEKILNAIIPSDPLQWDASSLVGQDPTMSRLEKFKEDVDADYRTKLAGRLETSYAAPTKADKPTYAPGSRVKVRGVWYVVGEDGDSLIPETQTASK